MKFIIKKVTPVPVVGTYFTYNGTPFKIIKREEGEVFCAWYDEKLEKILTSDITKDSGIKEKIWSNAVNDGRYKHINPKDYSDDFIYGIHSKLRDFKL